MVRPLALALLVCLATTPAGAQSAAETGAQRTATCSVAAYDVILKNEGDAPIPAGTVLTWEVRFARLDGTHKLEADLAPGGMVYLTGALVSSYLNPRVPCRAGVASP
jgi:hypothetical protein